MSGCNAIVRIRSCQPQLARAFAGYAVLVAAVGR